MRVLKDLYLATQNPNKLEEITNLFESQRVSDIRLCSLDDLPSNLIDKFSPEESGSNFMQNAYIKAICFSKILPGEYVIAEDSGLVVPALDGRPGIYSARYAETNEERIQKVLEELRPFPKSVTRYAFFFASLCYLDASQNPIFFQAKVEGEITQKPDGKAGFGYDPIFYSPEIKKTFAQASPHEKLRHSHRSKAFLKFLNYRKNC